MFDSQVIAAIIGAGAVLAAQAAWRWWARPKLLADFKGNDPAYFTHTEAGPHGRPDVVVAQARYLRIRVTNRGSSLARACRAYLVKVETLDDTQIWRPTIYCDSLRLKWSAQPVGEELRPMDLPKGVDQFVDVLSTMSHWDHYEMQIDVRLRRYATLFKERATLRYTILVAGDGVAPVKTRVAFRWSGVWNTCDAREA